MEICTACRGVVQHKDLVWRHELPYHETCAKELEAS